MTLLMCVQAPASNLPAFGEKKQRKSSRRGTEPAVGVFEPEDARSTRGLSFKTVPTSASVPLVKNSQAKALLVNQTRPGRR